MLSEHTGDRSDRHLCKVGSGGGEKEQVARGQSFEPES